MMFQIPISRTLSRTIHQRNLCGPSNSLGRLTLRSIDLMKEAKVIPLFPTSNVFFPGEFSRLYVFEPKYKLLMKSLDNSKPVIGFVRQPSPNEKEEFFPMMTDWDSATVGCLAEVLSHSKGVEGKEIVKLRFNERFSVHDAAREYVGYWRGTVQRLTDNTVSPSELQHALILSRTVSTLLNEYAKLAIGHDSKVFNRFQIRHNAVVTKGLVPFSFWVAMQIKAALPSTEENKSICQSLLEVTSVSTRLEHASSLLSQIIEQERDQQIHQAFCEEQVTQQFPLDKPMDLLKTTDLDDL